MTPSEASLSSNETTADVQAPPPGSMSFPAVPGYEILAEVGRGGMGVVYKARQKALNRLVALKMIRAGAQADDQEKARFRIEAQAVARLSHPNIVRIYEVGEHDGCPYFCLEFIDGISLDRWIAGTPRPPRDAAVLLAALAEAVQHAHQAGIVHRDLKPENVLLSALDVAASSPTCRPESAGLLTCRHDVPKITDFGLARCMEDRDRLTHSGVIVGTPCYMAPEQAHGKVAEVGPLCDVWALGAILYEMLTGRPPFKGASTAETLLLVATAEPVPPGQLAPGVPRDLQTICLKCLHKEPHRRFASARELADDLKRYLDGVPIRARPLGRLARAGRWCRRNPFLAGVSLLLLLALAGGVSGIVWQWQQAVHNYGEMLQQRQRAEEIAEDEAKQRRLADQQRRLAEQRELANLRFVYAARMNQLPNDWANGDLEAVQRHLEAFLPRPGQKHDVRGYEWHHYWKLTRGSRLTLHGHSRGIQALAFSHDGRLLASAGGTQIHLWDVSSGTRRDSVNTGALLTALTFAPGDRALLMVSNFGHGHAYDLDSKTYRFGAPKGRDPNQLLVSGGRFPFVDADAVLLRALGAHKQLTAAARAQPTALLPDGRTILHAGVTLEVHRLEGAAGKPVFTRRHEAQAHPGGTAFLALSADGRTAVTVGRDRAFKVWAIEGAARAPVQRVLFTRHPGPVSAIALAPDGRRLYTATGRLIHVWEVPAMRILRSLRGHARPIRRLVLSPDGKHLASGGEDSSVKVWDVAEGQAQTSLTRRPETSRAVALAFSADDRLLASGGSDAVVRVWDLTERRRRLALRRHGETVVGVAFGKEARDLLSVDRDGIVCRWDLAGGNLLARRELGAAVDCFASSPDGSLLACGGTDGQVRLLDLDGKEVRRFRPHATQLSALAFAPDGQLVVSGAWDGSAALGEVKTGMVRPCDAQLQGVVRSVTFSPDGKQVLACDHLGTVARWDAATGEAVGAAEHAHPCVSVVRDPQGKWLAWAGRLGGMGKIVQADRPRSGDNDYARTSWASEVPLAALACSHDGKRLAAADDDGGVTVLAADRRGWQKQFRLSGHAHRVAALTFSPDGRRLAQAAGFTVRLLDAASRRPLAVLNGHDDLVAALAFSPDGRTLASAGLDGTVVLWDGASGQRRSVLRGARLPVRALAFSPDGKTLAAGGGRVDNRGEVLLWDVQTARQSGQLPRQHWMVHGLTFLGDGRTLVTASGDGWPNIPGELKVWDVPSRRELFSAAPHASPIGAIALAADGKLLATAGSDDHVVHLWNVQPGPRLAARGQLRVPGGGRALAFSGDGRTLAVASRSEDVYFFQPELGQEVGRALLPAAVQALAFAPDRDTLAAGERTGTLHLLQGAAGEEVRPGPSGSGVRAARGELDEEAQRLRIAARGELATFLAGEGDAAGEEKMLAQASDELEQLARRAANPRSLLVAQVRLLLRLARRKQNDHRATEQIGRRIAELTQRLQESDPAEPAYLGLRLTALHLVAEACLAGKRHREARGPAEQAAELARLFVAAWPGSTANHEWVGRTLALVGEIYRAGQQTERALACYREIAGAWEEAARLAGFNDLRRNWIEWAQRQVCILSNAPGPQPPDSTAQRRRREMAEQLVLAAPGDVQRRRTAAELCRVRKYSDLRRLVRDGGISAAEADACCRRAVFHYAALVRLQPGQRQHRVELCSCLVEWAEWLVERKQDARAEKVYERLAGERRALRDQEPGQAPRHMDYLLALSKQSEAALRQRRPREVARALAQVTDVVRGARLSLGGPGKDLVLRSCGSLLHVRALAEAMAGDHPAALAAIEERLTLPLAGGDECLTVVEVLMNCRALAQKDSRLPQPVREKAVARYTERALPILGKAVELAPALRRRLATNPLLKDLRDRDDFRKLLRE